MYTHTVNADLVPLSETKLIQTVFFNYWRSSHDISLPKPKKKVYIVLEGDETKALRAMKVLKVYYGSRGNYWFLVNIAGIGICFVNNANGYYDSKEDFLKNNFTPIWDKSVAPINALNAVMDFGSPIEQKTFSDDDFFIRKWAWKDNHAVYTESKFAIVYDVALDSTSVIGIDPKEYIYRTEKDAIDANEVAVCEFEDEGEKNYEVMIEVIKTVTTSVKAKSAESVLENAKTAFSNVESYKVFIDGELAYESD